MPGAEIAKKELLNLGFPPNEINIKTSYSFTQKDLENSKTAHGDIDIKLIELAFKAYRKDALKDYSKLNKYILNAPKSFKSFTTNQMISNLKALKALGIGYNKDILAGGYSKDAIFLLTGKPTKTIKSPGNAKVEFLLSGEIAVLDELNNSDPLKLRLTEKNNFKFENQTANALKLIEEDCKDGRLDDFAVTISLKTNKGGHALAVTKIQDGIIYLKNSNCPDLEIKMSVEEFLSCDGHIDITPLTQKGEDAIKNIKTNPFDSN